MKRPLFILAALAFLAGCGTTQSQTKGIGSGADDYKRSPCACADFTPFPVIGFNHVS